MHENFRTVGAGLAPARVQQPLDDVHRAGWGQAPPLQYENIFRCLVDVFINTGEKTAGIILMVIGKLATKMSFTVSDRKQVTMKAVITAFFLGLVLISCTKSNGDTTGPDSITGKWELRTSSGGFAGTIIYPAGNGTVVIFSNNRQFRFTNTLVTDSGTYDIKKAAAPGSYWLELQYVYNGQTEATSDSIKVNGNQLIFFPASSCCDVPTNTYIKIP